MVQGVEINESFVTQTNNVCRNFEAMNESWD